MLIGWCVCVCVCVCVCTHRKKVVSLSAAPQGACEHTATPDQLPIRMFCENDFGKETP